MSEEHLPLALEDGAEVREDGEFIPIDPKVNQWILAITDHNGLEKVQDLIQSGANVNERLFACFPYLISDQENPFFESDQGTPLLFALNKNELQIAEALIDAGADVNVSDANGDTPLHAASRYSLYIAYLLIEKGANTNAKNHKGQTPLHLACEFGLRRNWGKGLARRSKFPKEIEELINDLLETDLHWRRLPSLFFYLITAQQTDVNVRDEDGQTPLHVLSVYSDLFPKGDALDLIVKALIDKGADVNQVDNHGQTALHFASRFLIPEMINILLKHGVNVNAVTDTKDTALHCATKSVMELNTSTIRAITEMLLEHGANIRAINSQGRTPLDNAKLHNDFKEIVPFMLSWKLKQAVTEGDLESFEWLLVQGKNVANASLLLNHSHLLCAARNDHSDIIQRLLAEGVSVNSVDSANNTALHWASENGNLDSVRLLLEQGASPKRRNYMGQLPLDLAQIQGHQSVVEHIQWWRSRSTIGSFVSSLLPGTTPNDKYLQRSIDDLSRQLADKENQCALLRREQEDSALIIEELLGKMDLTNDSEKLELKTNMEAVRQKTDKIDSLHSQMEQMMASIEELKVAKLSLNHKSSKADGQDTVSVKSFVTASVRSVMDSFKQKTCLLEAVVAGDEELVVRLLVKNPDLNMRDNDQQTPLFLACKYNRHDIIRRLIGRGADVNAANKDNATPLFIASENGYALVVDYLLENKADVNAPIRNNATPLLTASDNGHLFVVESLLKRGALINMSMKGGYTPLYLATKNDRREVVQVLLEHGADANASSDKKMSPLHRASIGGRREVAELLLEFGAAVDALNSEQDTPDASAEKHGQVEVRDLLASWRRMTQSERQIRLQNNKSRREKEKERLLRVSMSDVCSNIPVLFEQLAGETLRAEELRKTLEGLTTERNDIPEEDENVEGEVVYDAGAVSRRIDEVSRELASKELRVAELRREVADARRPGNDKVQNNIFLNSVVNYGVVHGPMRGDVGTINVNDGIKD